MTQTLAAIDETAPKPSLERRDGPGLVRFGAMALVFALSAVATVQLAAQGHPGWVVAVAVCAIALTTAFPAMHESGHGTAFRTAWLNEVVVWIGAVAMLQSPTFFREFHWEHHRETQDPERDPEIAKATTLMDDWPRNLAHYALVVSGQMLMFGKPGLTLACALAPRSLWTAQLAFVRPALQRRVAWESRLVVALLGGGAWLGMATVDGFGAFLLAWPLSHVILGFYLMPEHTGLPHDGSQIHRTRTVRSNALVRWLMWNMPYHAEHHDQPGVPFHALPVLHERIAPQLEHVSDGYAAFHREALRRARGRAPQAAPATAD